MITKIDRLARNTRSLGEIVETLHQRGVGLKVLQFGRETLDTTGAYGRLMLNMFSAFAEFERDLMKERQKEGIAKAKAERKYKGRKPTARAKAGVAVTLFKGGKSVSEVAKEVGIGRGSVYRALQAAGLKKLEAEAQPRSSTPIDYADADDTVSSAVEHWLPAKRHSCANLSSPSD